MSRGSTPGEQWPEALLCKAAAELEARHPKNVCWLDFYGQQVVAHVAWCGVVVLTDRTTGQRLGQSKPGQPAVLDHEA